MKKIAIFILTLFTFFRVQAQVVEGTIYDSKTRETIPGAAIYLDGTSIITTSDKDGRFRLVIENKMNTSLVFSHLSYESIVIKPPFEGLGNAFYLKEKVHTLAEARVVAHRDLFPPDTKMRVFREQFLGKSIAGRSCVIRNEQDIELTYNSGTHTLVAIARNPIIVENKHLSYLVTFDLHHFSIQYTENTLNMDKAIKITFKGTSSFVDQNPYNVRYKTRRDEIHLRSKQYFFKHLVNHTLPEGKFRLFNRLTRIEAADYFIIPHTGIDKTVMLIPETNIRRTHERVVERPIYGVVGILCDDRYRSEVVFLTNRILVDGFGNPDTIDHLIFFGDLGEQRLGDMLPIDYSFVRPQTSRR